MRTRVKRGNSNIPDNFAILFGPKWESMVDIHDEQRLQVLLIPTPVEGSPMQAMSSYLDEGCPKWNPRSPSEEEKSRVSEAADQIVRLQGLLRRV